MYISKILSNAARREPSSYWFYCYSMYLRLLWEFCHRCSEAETRPSIQSVSRGLCYHLCYHLPISYLSGTTWVPPASLITLWYHLCYHLSDNYLVPLWYFSGTSLGPPVVSPASLILLWYLSGTPCPAAFPFSRLCTRVLYCLRCYEFFWKHGKLHGLNLCKLWIQDLWMGRSQESCLPLL